MSTAIKCTNEIIHNFTLSVLAKAERDYLGKDVFLDYGKYRNRRGKITGIILDQRHNYQLLFLIQPYSLKDEGELLWDDAQARSYHPIEHFHFVESRLND